MESVRSAFHAQLATVMDSLLAAAVCEIVKIFENSLCEQQAELAQKTQEISILRCKLEKVERRQKVKGGRGEEGEMSSGIAEGSTNQQTLAGSEPAEGLNRSLSRLKEEVTSQDGSSIKHEHGGSKSTQESFSVQDTEGNLAAGDQRRIDGLSATQTKTKLSNWNQSSCSADHRSIQDQPSTPFLSISQSGRCSPRPDPSLPQPGEWLPGLDTTRNGVADLENHQADGNGCSAPASSSTGTDPSCFQPGFGSDETSNEDDNSFSFLNQDPENQSSCQNSVHGHDMGLRDTQQDQSQTPSDVSPWRTRDDGGVRDCISHTRRVTNFGNRNPLRPQSNSQSLALRNINALGHPPALTGGNGRPYTCPYCTKCFTYPSHQRRHLLRHTGVRLHPCQFCDKSFLTPSELTVHTRTHTGERPFGCAQCGKRFARSGNLRAHQRDVHMGKRPFACTECGKRFAHRGNLRVHNHRVHQGDPYYIDDQPEPDIGPSPI
ncbi:oocyte zinc finger protein XlCOF7.1-like [Melanotaenia boesemani]|uniref:oocyte zinc finger protein XlCOF7.1-like n=1 Tax=Melanotaenia boesemani TaxID=1250792 RepID=UPI001C054709|nr:oocyte zinc finger protein XlCOF7.1-like [Melanotaenia boesemani]